MIPSGSPSYMHISYYERFPKFCRSLICRPKSNQTPRDSMLTVYLVSCFDFANGSAVFTLPLLTIIWMNLAMMQILPGLDIPLAKIPTDYFSQRMGLTTTSMSFSRGSSRVCEITLLSKNASTWSRILYYGRSRTGSSMRPTTMPWIIPIIYWQLASGQMTRRKRLWKVGFL